MLYVTIIFTSLDLTLVSVRRFNGSIADPSPSYHEPVVRAVCDDVAFGVNRSFSDMKDVPISAFADRKANVISHARTLFITSRQSIQRSSQLIGSLLGTFGLVGDLIHT